MLQSQAFAPNLQLTLNCIQLAVYVIILGLAIFKLTKSAKNSRDFLTKFYISITVIACIEIGLQSYQVSAQAKRNQPQVYIFVIINLYAMSCEAFAIFLLSDYWHQTQQIITKTSTEIQLKEEKHWVRHLLIFLWLAIYTAYIAYALATNNLKDSETFQLILALGCQGIGATIMLWAILLQVIRGYHLASAVGRYEEWLNRTSINKVHFRCIYWMTSIFNFLRIVFLITMTIVIEVYNAEVEWQWFASYIYTGTNCIVLLVYILGFSTKSNQQMSKLSTLLEGGDLQRQSNSTRSRHETELSSSISDRSNK